MRKWFRNNLVYAIALLIVVLLAGNIYLIYRNSEHIERNKNLYEKAGLIKANTVEIIRNLHLLDMALRSYALVRQSKYIAVADSSIQSKDNILNHLERDLKAQGYEMERFHRMRDSVEAYYAVIGEMRTLLVEDRFDEFSTILARDPGYSAWLAYVPFEEHVFAFEEEVSARAQEQYRLALRNSYWLQVVIFLIAAPTLAFMAYFTKRSLQFSKNVNASIRENLHSVAQQKVMLEEMVRERTSEILKQKEEIAARNEQLLSHQREIEVQRNELRAQNAALQDAKKIIEQQHREIKKRHDELAVEVDRRTQDLKTSNLELAEYNNRLEQFTYIISHNLRAPLARLTGLASLLDHANGREESDRIVRMMIRSTGELDQVIRDLGVILGVQRTGSVPVAEVNLEGVVEKTINMLAPEIEEYRARIEYDLKTKTFSSLPPYIDSILYNLISNALKYRHPDRAPHIRISSQTVGDKIKIEVADNGLGIDLDRNGSNLFSLYKRFHFHVEGKGMGLFLVKTQVAALGGTIGIDSRVGEGTTFQLAFNGRMNGANESDSND